MRGTTGSGSWSTWDTDGCGKRRKKTLKVASKCKRGEALLLRKGAVGAARGFKPEGSGITEERTGRKQAIGFQNLLDGKTLKHAKTTEAENRDW